MLTSIILFAFTLGTDPEIVFSQSVAPWTKSVTHEASQSSTLLDSRNPSADEAGTIFRGQSIVDQPPGVVNAYQYPPGYQPPPENFWNSPFVEEFVSAMNPFKPEQVRTIKEYYDPFGFQMGTGSFGPPGYRLGWTTYNDFAFLPSSAARGTTGSMQITEWNSYLRYSHLIGPGMLFNSTGYFNARWWEGPSGVPVPGQVDQVSTDLELAFFDGGPWSGQIAFHPQIVETYEARLDKNAFNFDGRAIATYKATPEWSFVGGVAIWDRVDLMIVPHAGVIWTPNNQWEFRILYPKTRISYFLGNWNNADVWLYGEAEYTAEAWQSVDKQTSSSDRLQMTDDRVGTGVRWDAGRYSLFVEGGYVFNRQIKFAGSNPSFDLTNTGMIRAGLRY